MTNYYIRTDGNNANNGLTNTSGGAWRDLSYACSQVSGVDDVINVGVGTFNDASECVLAEYVSIVGAGTSSSIIHSTYESNRDGGDSNHASINLSSVGSGPIDGNQSISFIKLTGGLDYDCTAIVVNRRNGVIIHDCSIQDFYITGVSFLGCDYENAAATDNELYNCTISNCGQGEYPYTGGPAGWDAGSCLVIMGQTGMLIHDNTFSNVDRGIYCSRNIGGGGYCKDTKFYNNKLYKPDPASGTAWNMHMEMTPWNNGYGFEIYDNEFYGSQCAIDMAADTMEKGIYDYSFYIHDNLFELTGYFDSESYGGICTISVEALIGRDVWVYRNRFVNSPRPFGVTDGGCGYGPTAIYENLYYCYNILENVGWGDVGHWALALSFGGMYSNTTLTNVNILNNVIIQSSDDYLAGISISGWDLDDNEVGYQGTITNFNIKNNIIVGFKHSYEGAIFVKNSGTIDEFHIDNNIFYDNAQNNTPVILDDSSISNYTFNNNIQGEDPSFYSSVDFHLLSNSPAINAGIDVSIATDYEGNAVGDPPEIGAYEYVGTIYYIDEAGVDGSGHTGLIDDPWASLSYACTRATTSGDTIHVNVGTFVEDTQSELAEGVSIVGAGNTSIIHSDISDSTILLSSPSLQDGNQSISYVRLEGNTDYSSIWGIEIVGRSNVLVHHCEFEYFRDRAISFSGYWGTATGNKFYNNTVNDCANFNGTWCTGAVCDGGQQGLEIYNSSITVVNRDVSANGYAYKFYDMDGGFSHGTKIYNNTLIVPPRTESFNETPQGAWTFAIEIWNSRGGFEIYNNIIEGGIDFAGDSSMTNIDDNGYGFTGKIYDNSFGYASLNAYTGGDDVTITIERTMTGGLYIYNNTFTNLSMIFGFSQGPAVGAGPVDHVEDVYIYYNICNNIGFSDAVNQDALHFAYIINDNDDVVYDNFNFLNNVFNVGSAYLSSVALRFNLYGAMTNLAIKNNIFIGFIYQGGGYPVYFEGGSIDYVSVKNNLFYGNGVNGATEAGATITNSTYDNNYGWQITPAVDPLFVDAANGNFYLQGTSPAIDTGLDLNLAFITTDYDGVTVSDPPEIGAYEYVGTTYYLASDGSDNNTGTIGSPWFTLNRAWEDVSAGDTIYMRGGTYEYTSRQSLTGKSGTAGNLINIQNYPDETPVITRNSGYTISGIYFEGDYVHFKGLEITGYTEGDDFHGFYITNANHNIFELINCHHVSGMGMWLNQNVDDNLVLNCDFHHCYNPYHYGNSDGFGLNSGVGTTNTVRGCRSWLSSDDGYDYLGSDGLIITDSCWAWMHGYREDQETAGGDGSGFKLGPSVGDYPSTHLRTFTNCLSFNNRMAGFSQEFDAPGTYISWVYNNTAYNNDGMSGWWANFGFNGSTADTLKNNIAYVTPYDQNATVGDNCITSNNTKYPGTQEWNGTVTVSDADFVSLDPTGVDGSRGADGSLPLLTFLHLASDSSLRGAGVAITGLITDGDGVTWLNPPSIGAYEYNDSSTSVPTVTTASISSITSSTATGGGNVTHDGSIALTYRGICWRPTSANPTVADASTQDAGTGEGSYVSYLTSLSASTNYHVRAFAYNSDGLSYGSDVEFNTSQTSASASTGTFFINPFTNKILSYNGKFLILS